MALLPVPRFTVPVVPESRVNALVVFEVIVSAPLSVILLVVNVVDPIAVPVMNVPTPLLLILVVPLSVKLPPVIATSPVVAVSPLLAVISPEEVIVPDPVTLISPGVTISPLPLIAT